MQLHFLLFIALWELVESRPQNDTRNRPDILLKQLLQYLEINEIQPIIAPGKLGDGALMAPQRQTARIDESIKRAISSDCTDQPLEVNRIEKTCQAHLDTFSQSSFCSRPDIFQTKCCATWTKTCIRIYGKLPCLDSSTFVAFTLGASRDCEGHLGHYGQTDFCGNPQPFQTDCCVTWAKTCTRVNGILPCLGDKLFKVQSSSMSCDGYLKQFGKHDFCLKGNTQFLKEEHCCASYDTTCKQAVWKPSNDPYVVELLVVVDPRAQDIYLAENNYNKHNAKKSILNDIDYFLTEVNKLFHNFYGSETFNIQVSKKKVILLDEDFLRTDVVNGEFVDKYVTVAKFNQYLKDTSAKDIYDYDHATFLSGYDFMIKTPSDASVVGSAEIGKACLSEGASSIVEYDGTYNVVGTMAHEIGHNLGADHDKQTDPYVMAPSNNNPDERWSFSPLSATYMKQYIADLDQIDNNCLQKPSSPGNTPNTPITDALADPDTICGRAWGAEWYYDSTMKNADGRDRNHGDLMCNKIYCRSDQHTLLNAAYSSDGLACGIRKTCNEGQCVSSTSTRAAQVTDESCIFGDVKMIFGKTCDQTFISDKNMFCGDQKKTYKARCCGSWHQKCDGNSGSIGATSGCRDQSQWDIGRVTHDGHGTQGIYTTCQGHLDIMGQTYFCANHKIFQTKCCATWANTCISKKRKWLTSEEEDDDDDDDADDDDAAADDDDDAADDDAVDDDDDDDDDADDDDDGDDDDDDDGGVYSYYNESYDWYN